MTKEIIKRVEMSIDRQVEENKSQLVIDIAKLNEHELVFTVKVKIKQMGNEWSIKSFSDRSINDKLKFDDHEMVYDPDQPELPYEDEK
jgi:hypothetical protein